MSTSVNSKARALLPHVPLPRPRLTVVPRVDTSPRRLPFVVLVIAVLAAGLVGLLLLNTSMERGAYRVTALRDEAATLTARQQQLQLQVASLGDPQEVAEKALRLGMVQNPSPAFLLLSTGAVVGHSVAGTAADRFDMAVTDGRDANRLHKVVPLVGGEANNAGGGGIIHAAPPPPKTKGHDTGTGSPARQ